MLHARAGMWCPALRAGCAPKAAPHGARGATAHFAPDRPGRLVSAAVCLACLLSCGVTPAQGGRAGSHDILAAQGRACSQHRALGLPCKEGDASVAAESMQAVLPEDGSRDEAASAAEGSRALWPEQFAVGTGRRTESAIALVGAVDVGGVSSAADHSEASVAQRTDAAGVGVRHSAALVDISEVATAANTEGTRKAKTKRQPSEEQQRFHAVGNFQNIISSLTAADLQNSCTFAKPEKCRLCTYTCCEDSSDMIMMLFRLSKQHRSESVLELLKRAASEEVDLPLHVDSVDSYDDYSWNVEGWKSCKSYYFQQEVEADAAEHSSALAAEIEYAEPGMHVGSSWDAMSSGEVFEYIIRRFQTLDGDKDGMVWVAPDFIDHVFSIHVDTQLKQCKLYQSWVRRFSVLDWVGRALSDERMASAHDIYGHDQSFDCVSDPTGAWKTLLQTMFRNEPLRSKPSGEWRWMIYPPITPPAPTQCAKAEDCKPDSTCLGAGERFKVYLEGHKGSDFKRCGQCFEPVPLGFPLCPGPSSQAKCIQGVCVCADSTSNREVLEGVALDSGEKPTPSENQLDGEKPVDQPLTCWQRWLLKMFGMSHLVD